MNNASEQLYIDLTKHFNHGVIFSGRYDFDDGAWYISAKDTEIEPFRVGDEDARTKSYDEILNDAIEHFQSFTEDEE